MLQLQSPDDIRVPLGSGAVAILAPIDSLAWLKAQGASRVALLEGGDDAPHRSRLAMIGSLVRTGLRGLEGIADVDGSPIEGQPTEEQIDRLLGWFPAYSALEEKYAGPILEAQAEKNGFAPSQGTISTPTAGTDTARAATPTETPGTADALSAPSD